MTTGVAVNAQESVREHAAAEEGAKLFLDEARGCLLPVGSSREKAFELLANDLMKESLLRFMALVLGHEVPHRDRGRVQRKKLEPIGRHGTGARRHPREVLLTQ